MNAVTRLYGESLQFFNLCPIMDEIRYLSREIIAAYPPTCSLVTKLRGTLGNIIVSKTYNILLNLQNNKFKSK